MYILILTYKSVEFCSAGTGITRRSVSLILAEALVTRIATVPIIMRAPHDMLNNRHKIAEDMSSN